MKRLTLLITLCLIALTGMAQTAPSLREVTEGTLRARRINGVNPLADGLHYAQISPDGERIVKYSFKTGEEAGVIFDVKTARGQDLKRVEGYIMSPDESRILIQTYRYH